MHTEFLGSFAKLEQGNNSAPTGWIFMKFDI